MPFTLSHAVLAPPFAKMSRHFLPIAALAIGCMSPDLYRLFSRSDDDVSHQWQSVYTLNLVVGLFFSALWYLLYRPFIYSCLNLQDPLKLDSVRHSIGFTFRSSMAIMIGAATHLIWDGLTHLDFRSFAFESFLAQELHFLQYRYPIHRVLQIGSSIFVMPILIWMAWDYVQKHHQKRRISTRLQQFRNISLTLSGFAATVAYIHFAEKVAVIEPDMGLYAYLGYASNQLSSAFLVVFTLSCLLYRILQHYDYFRLSNSD